jgi:hypothetical protein
MCTRFVSGACQRPQPLKDTSLPTRPNPLKPLHTNGRSDTIMQASTSLSVDAQALQAAPIYGRLVIHHYGDRKAILVRDANYSVCRPAPTCRFPLTGYSGRYRSLAATSE